MPTDANNVRTAEIHTNGAAVEAIAKPITTGATPATKVLGRAAWTQIDSSERLAGIWHTEGHRRAGPCRTGYTCPANSPKTATMVIIQAERDPVR